MAKQTINIGSSVNSGDGDPLRTAFDKVNDNFDELYARAENTDSQTLILVGNTLSISGGNSVELNISPVGDLKGSVFADDSTLLVDAVNASIPYSVLSDAPSFGNWTFSSSVLSDGSTGNAIIQSSDFAGSKLILRARGPSDQDWIFDQDGNLTFPDSSGSIIPSVSDGGGLTVQAEQDLELKVDDGEGGSAIWSFEPNGSITFPDSTVQSTAWNVNNVDWAAIIGASIQATGLPVQTKTTTPVPASSIGATGDLLGAFTFDSTYAYYCTANYDGSTNIWKRVAWSGDTW